MGKTIKALKRHVVIAACVAAVMIAASVPAFSQYRYDRSRSVRRSGSILGQIFGNRGVRRRPVVYGRFNRNYRYNDYYRGNNRWGNRFDRYNNNYYRRDDRHWRGRGFGHYRARGRGHW